MRQVNPTLVFGLIAFASGCGEVTPPAAAGTNPDGNETSAGALGAARPRPPATPTILATATDQEFLRGLLLSGGNVLFGGGHTIALPPEAGPPSEMVGVLRSVPADGGAVTELWTGNGGVDDIAPASGALLFVAYDFFSRTGHLNRIPATGGAAAELAAWSSHGSSHSVTSAVDVAYWTHSAGAGTFVKRTTADGTTVTLADSETIQGSSADNIVIEDGVLYFVASQATRAVFAMPADGSAAPRVLFTAPQIDALAAAPTERVLIAGAGNSVVAIDVRRGRSRTLWSGAGTVTAVAVDDRAVYVGSSEPATGAGTVARLSRRHGGRPAVLATGTFTPTAMAVDAASVYWLDGAGRTVSKVAK